MVNRTRWARGVASVGCSAYARWATADRRVAGTAVNLSCCRGGLAALAVMLAAVTTAHATSGTWTNTGAGAVGYWTNNANWSGATYPGTANAESAGLNRATPNTYTCILDTVARYFPDYVEVTIGNSGGGNAWLVITNGGGLATYNGFVNPNGHIVVSGANARFGKHQMLCLGGGSNATLRIENGAGFLGQNSTFGVHVGGSGYGGNAGTNCSIVVTGPGSTFTNNAGAQQTQVGSGAGSVSNSVWVLDGGRMVTTITLSSESSSLTVSGAGSTFEGAVVMGGSNTLVTVSDGGILEANTLDTSANLSLVITNSGGIYQFTTATPTITTNGNAGGSIFLNGGAIAFRNVSSGLNITNNTDATRLGRLTYCGNNALRLNNSTLTSGLGYTFDTGLGATHWCRLEMVGGTTRVNGAGFSIGAGGGLLFSNTTTTIAGAVTNHGQLVLHNSLVTFATNLVMGAGMGITLTGTNNLPVMVKGTFTLPATATVSLPAATLGKNDSLTLFQATNLVASGGVGGWTTPASHRVSLGANQLLLVPRQQGLMLMVE